MQALAQKHCAPCHGEAAKLSAAEVQAHLANLIGWQMADNAIIKRYSFKDFKQALAFTNKIGEVAEAENHHPDLTLGWGYVGVTLTTHDCGGLSLNDMIMASKIEALTA